MGILIQLDKEREQELINWINIIKQYDSDVRFLLDQVRVIPPNFYLAVDFERIKEIMQYIQDMDVPSKIKSIE
jgi:hypothetical protein